MSTVNSFYGTSVRAMAALRRQGEALQTRIATGERLSRPSDDPLAASRLRGLARAEALAGAHRANADRARTDLSLADNALTQIGDAVIRAQELAAQAATGTLNPGQRAAIGTELVQLRAGLLQLGNARDTSGRALFGGETAGDAFAPDGTYLGTASAGELTLGDGQSVTRGVTGPDFGGPALLATIKGLADALQTGDAAAASAALAPLHSSLEGVTTAQAVVGARLGWIELTTTRAEQRGEARAEAQAVLGGTDIAETVTRLQQAMTVLEASQASFARLSGLSLFDALR